MNTSNFSKLPNSLEKLHEYFGIQGFKASDPHQKGFVRVPNILIKYANRLGLAGSKATLFMLLVALLARDYQNQGFCYPSHSQIAEDLGLAVNSVERGLRNLRAAGIVEIENQFDGKTFRNNRYTWNGLRAKLRKLLIEDGLIDD